MAKDACLVVVIGAEGSLAPAEIAVSCADTATLVFLADSEDAATQPLLPVASSLAPTVVVDFSDTEACLQAVRQAGASAVTTFVDRLCPFAAWLDREACGYRGSDARWGRKDFQRRALRDAGVSRVRSSLVNSAAELRAFARQVGYPCVVKPVDGFAARNTWKLETDGDREEFIVSAEASAQGWPTGLYAEEFIRGEPRKERWIADYASADVLRSGRPGAPESPALVTARTPLVWPFRETGLIIPWPLSDAHQQVLAATARSGLDAIGAGRGAYHVELKSAPYGPEIIEVNGRIGGFVARALHLASGEDLGQLALACALGREPVLEPSWKRHVYMMLHQPPAAARRVVRIPGRRELLRRPGVIAVDHIAASGTAVHWTQGLLGMAARAWLAADSPAELRERIIGVTQFLNDEFEYLDDSGRSVQDDSWLATISR